MWGPWRRPLPSMATQITVPMLVGEFWMSCSRKPITPTKGICHTNLWSTGFRIPLTRENVCVDE
jgi:hypothetical protein